MCLQLHGILCICVYRAVMIFDHKMVRYNPLFTIHFTLVYFTLRKVPPKDILDMDLVIRSHSSDLVSDNSFECDRSTKTLLPKILSHIFCEVT